MCVTVCGLTFFQGEVEAYGSHAELLSRGMDPLRLLGLKNEEVDDLNDFAIREDVESTTGHAESEGALLSVLYSNSTSYD